MSKHVEERDGDNCLELPEPNISQQSSKYRAEVTEQVEGVVDNLE